MIPLHALINGGTPLVQTHPSPQQRKVKDQRTDPEVQRKRNYNFKETNDFTGGVTDNHFNYTRPGLP